MKMLSELEFQKAGPELSIRKQVVDREPFKKASFLIQIKIDG